MIEEALSSGARKYKACEELGITVRTCQRWTQAGKVKGDGRAAAKRTIPANKLTQEEREQVLEITRRQEFRNLPPSQIVPTLADGGEYIASESSFYRILHEAKQQNHRGRSKAPERRPLTTHVATAPNQIWCWDISWLPGSVKGLYFYLYLILDVFSRKIVGWEIHDIESSEHAATLVTKAHLSEGVGTKALVLHSDNGSPMKGSTLLETMYRLNVISSYSRPRVSNDNAYVESLFRTCKYRPEYPFKGFEDIKSAREWVLQFVHWYNHNHRHSGLKFITPNERHDGRWADVLEQRKNVYVSAKARNPNRWSGGIRNWDLPDFVTLNPEKNEMELVNVG